MENNTIQTKRIVILYRYTRRIAQHFGCSGQTVRNALRFLTDGELPDAIRKEALKNYGGAISTINRNLMTEEL